jgi:hypothetical protein
MGIDDVYRDFSDGLLTVKGAVFCAIAATCKFGDPVNFNVSEFLARTGIHPRSYSRAVASLIEQQRLDFPPNAVQTLRIPVVHGTRRPVYYSLSANSGQICPESGQICDRDGQICPEDGQICPEDGQICPDRSPKLPSDADSEASSISLSTLSISLSKGEIEGDTEDPEYEEWLTRKASQLPTPPTLLEEWLEANRSKKGNRKQFQKYKESMERAALPSGNSRSQNLNVKNDKQQRLETLQFWWGNGDQARAVAAIAAHPEWGIRIGELGPEHND